MQRKNRRRTCYEQAFQSSFTIAFAAGRSGSIHWQQYSECYYYFFQSTVHICWPHRVNSIRRYFHLLLNTSTLQAQRTAKQQYKNTIERNGIEKKVGNLLLLWTTETGDGKQSRCQYLVNFLIPIWFLYIFIFRFSLSLLPFASSMRREEAKNRYRIGKRIGACRRSTIFICVCLLVHGVHVGGIMAAGTKHLIHLISLLRV